MALPELSVLKSPPTPAFPPLSVAVPIDAHWRIISKCPDTGAIMATCVETGATIIMRLQPKATP